MLGLTVEDRTTGFKGIVTGRVEYLTGCNQCLVVPKMGAKETKKPDGEWFDEQRLVIVGNRRVTLDNSKATGPDREAPKR